MENQIVILPSEVKELAVKVSEKKQAEVNNVLNQIFTGTADWEKQVDAIEVKGIDDKMSIQMADVARKNVKTARLAAEKLFDAKRDEVQQLKSEYDLEDKLWLKAKQVMQIKFKAIEEKAEWKAKTIERYEAEQKELRTQIRIEKVAKFNSEINRNEFESMSNDMFDIFISALEKSHNDKIEAEQKAEAERIARAKAIEAEQERIRQENERLKIEAEQKEKALAIERQKAEAERKALEEKVRKEKEIADAKLKEQQAKAEAEAKAAAEKQAKLQAELKAKAEAERKALEEKNKQLKAEAEAKRKEANAPDKIKLIALAKTINELPLPELKSVDALNILNNIKDLLGKTSKYIIDKSETL